MKKIKIKPIPGKESLFEPYGIKHEIEVNGKYLIVIRVDASDLTYEHFDAIKKAAVNKFPECQVLVMDRNLSFEVYEV